VKTAPARANECRHARIVPAVDAPLLDELDQLALREYDVGKIEAREFDLLRQRPLQQAALRELFQQPVVERPLVFEFERADRMRDVLQRVLDRVRIGVHRVEAPLVTRVVVRGALDAIDGRVAQVDVARRHVDFRPQHVRAVGELAGLHAPEQVEVFGDATIAIRTGLARLGERAAIGAHLVRRLRIDIGVARFDQVLGEPVHPVEIVGGVVEVVAPT